MRSLRCSAAPSIWAASPPNLSPRPPAVTVATAVLPGVILGACYAVLACGLSVMLGVMRFLTLAHGGLAVLGAYLILVVVERAGAPAVVGFLVALRAMIVLGYV